jgi:hypothetical protein
MIESGEEREATMAKSEESKVYCPKNIVYRELKGVYRRLGAVSG